MKNERARAIVLSVVAVVLVVLGFLLAGACGGGLSLGIFGVAVGVLGAVIARGGGLAVLLPAGIIAITLVSYGILVAAEVGC